MTKINHDNNPYYPWRFYCVLLILMILAGLLTARMVYLTVFDRSFLLNQGNSRYLRLMEIPAYRGMIMDRHGEPLAVSTPVDSVWINPQDFDDSSQNEINLSQLLNITPQEIHHLMQQSSEKEFVYLKRNVNPGISKQVAALSISGVYLEHTYRRYYPEAEVAAHVVGFTNVDDQGQEGLELAYNSWLQGRAGKARVLKDLYGHVLAVLDNIKEAESGHDLTLSVDEQIQFLAYSVLKSTVEKYHAISGSVIVMNPKTGEILAMVNQPSYNPNQRLNLVIAATRNRAVTDVFEPGSTLKAFSIAAALSSGKYTPLTKVDTNPGWLDVGRNRVFDDKHEKNGVITVTRVLQKSSNIGAAKITLSLPPENLLNLLRQMGFGDRTLSAFPGESAGSLPRLDQLRPFELATLAFGYGISVTTLQLTQAYAAIANHGLQCPPTFLKRDTAPTCVQVMNPALADQMLSLLEVVMEGDGTGRAARVPGYRIAGKTGTAYKAEAFGGYNRDNKRFTSSFIGIAPVEDPQLVVAVIVNEPQAGYYGAVVSAPAFAQIMGGSLRILNIQPTVNDSDMGQVKVIE